MISTSHNSIVLKKSNETRLNVLFSQFSKGEPNTMKFSQYMMFILDRCIISNTFSLTTAYNLFNDAIANRPVKKQQIPQTNEKSVPNVQRFITKQQLINIINRLGQILFRDDPNFQDRIYNEVLSQKAIVNKDSLQHPRVMIFDDTNRRFLTENAIKMLNLYQNDLLSLFVIYINENYVAMKKQDRILLSELEICLQNKKMTAVSFLRFIKQSQIAPHLINIQHVEECLAKVVPASVARQTEFFYKHFLVQAYSKQIDKLSQVKHDGDPGLLFFQFQFMLARMSWQIYRDTDKKLPQNMLKYLFSKYLYVRPNDQPELPYPVTTKAHLNKLQTYHEKYQQQSSQQYSQSEEQEQFGRGFITNKQNELMNLPPCKLDILGTLKSLDKQLPQMPPLIQVKQQYPPPFPFDIKLAEPKKKKKKKSKDTQPKNDKVIIGQQPPPPPVDKNKQKPSKPQVRKPMRKAGQPIPRVFAWQQQPKYQLKSEDYLQKLSAQLDNELKPLSSIQRGVMNVQPIPCIISEILYPPQVPQLVLPYLEAAINSHNQGNFFSALDNYQKAQDQWKKSENISSNIQLFFQYTRATVYVSAGHDDYALQGFVNCRQYTDSLKMQYLSPDRALPWCGIGQTCFNTQQYELSARSYLKARQIRQPLLGIESVDTATTMNNLGCCFFMLDRNKQALSYFKICYAIFQAQLGTFHERTQTAFSNMKKSQRGQIQQIPQYRKLWQVYQKDPFGKKKKKKKGKKK